VAHESKSPGETVAVSQATRPGLYATEVNIQNFNFVQAATDVKHVPHLIKAKPASVNLM
jgi:hypothetical protein